MKLDEYLNRYKTPLVALARQIGVSETTIRKIRDGSGMSLDVALRIEDATYGEVTCRDLKSSQPNKRTKPRGKTRGENIKRKTETPD